MPSIKPVPYYLLVRVFENEGFKFDRQKGDHLFIPRQKPNDGVIRDISFASSQYSSAIPARSGRS